MSAADILLFIIVVTSVVMAMAFVSVIGAAAIMKIPLLGMPAPKAMDQIK